MINEWGASDLSKKEFNEHLDEEEEIRDFSLRAEIRGSIKSSEKERREKLTNLFKRFRKKIEKEKLNEVR